jgi:hypothetical protein
MPIKIMAGKGFYRKSSYIAKRINHFKVTFVDFVVDTIGYNGTLIQHSKYQHNERNKTQ